MEDMNRIIITLDECVETIESLKKQVEEMKNEDAKKEIRMPEFSEIEDMADGYCNERFYLTDTYKRKLNLLDILLIARDWVWDNIENGYRPDWRDDNPKYVIFDNSKRSRMEVLDVYSISRIFAFKSKETAEKFLKKYRPQIEEIKEFL
jgi:hypothetical protein